MTIVANTFLTFAAVGNREDLQDAIYMISPTDTPFMANVGKTTCKSTLHEWQTDSLAPAAANAQLQGDETTFAAVTPTVRVNNRTQISRKEVVISMTQEVVSKAGRKSEMTRELMKKGKELRRDMEFVLLNNQAPVTGNATTAPQLRPVNSWYDTNDSRGASGSAGSASTAATDGTQRAFTEAGLKNVLQLCYTAGGEPDMIMVGPFNKGVISGFTGGATRFDKSEDKKLVASVDVYEGDFGTYKFVPNRFQRERDVHVLQTDMWDIAYLRPMKTEDLAKTGDAMKAHIITEYTLVCRNEASSGIFADATTS